MNPGPFTHHESESHSVVSDSLQPHGLYSLWDSPGQNTRMGSSSLFQGIYPTQVKLSYWHYRWIIYQLSHHGSPLETIRNIPIHKWEWSRSRLCIVTLLC